MIDDEQENVQQAEPEAAVSADALAIGGAPAEAEEAAPAAETPEEAPAPTGEEHPRIVLKRSGAETENVYEIHSPAIIGRFDPAVGPIDVDLGPLDEGRYVSRKHAKIVFEDGAWKLVDLGSSNGTFILRSDFEKVDEVELADGSEVALGNARFVFHLS
jgi:pSer/pThr/pTyr-binding forkhead associated (FHA) protein